MAYRIYTRASRSSRYYIDVRYHALRVRLAAGNDPRRARRFARAVHDWLISRRFLPPGEIRCPLHPSEPYPHCRVIPAPSCYGAKARRVPPTR